jgi:DNA sulfur modification protein DndC
MQLSKVNRTIETFKNLFLNNWVVTVGLSGKDSACVSHCAVEGLRAAMAVNPTVGPLYLVTTNTTIDNFELHGFILDVHAAAMKYGRDYNLPIITKEINPSLSSLPMVEYIGRGKLLRTPATSTRGRDCTISWKIDPMKRFLRDLKDEHQTTKIVSASGTRSQESAIRAANIEKRNESAIGVVNTPLGFTIAPIKDWELTDVWSLLTSIENDDIESYLESNAKGLRKHYSAGNDGLCDLFAGDNLASNKACGARFGCFLCAMVDNDTSLESQINTSFDTYGYMAPMLKFREFMINTLYDYSYSRSMIGRQIKDGGYIKIGYNQYSISYRQDLLRFMLTIDAQEAEAFYTKYGYEGARFQMIGYKELIMIQFQWIREGGEKLAGEALRIWHDVHTHGKRYAIPETTYAEPKPLPKYRYYNINGYVKQHGCPGLHEDNVYGLMTGRLHRLAKIGNDVDLVPFEEGEKAEIDVESGMAWDFVENWFPDALAGGLFNHGKCPTTLLKVMLECKLIKLRKGTLPRLHKEVQRAQVYSALSQTYGDCYQHLCFGASISEEEYKENLKAGVEHQEAAKAQSAFNFDQVEREL